MEIYQFINHHWESIEEGVFLRQKISSDLVEQFTKHGSTLFQQQSGCDKADEKAYAERIKQTQNIT